MPFARGAAYVPGLPQKSNKNGKRGEKPWEIKRFFREMKQWRKECGLQSPCDCRLSDYSPDGCGGAVGGNGGGRKA